MLIGKSSWAQVFVLMADKGKYVKTKNLAHFTCYMFPNNTMEPLALVRLRSSWTLMNSVMFVIFGATEYKNMGILMNINVELCSSRCIYNWPSGLSVLF